MRIEFAFGVGFDRDNVPLQPAHVATGCKAILIHASRMFGGCNLLAGQGAWVDQNGTLILEDSRTLVVDVSAASRFATESTSADDEKIADLAEFIRVALNQAAVHVTKLVATSKDVVAIC